MEKHGMEMTYITKQQVNHREEDEIINKSLSCTELVGNEYQTDKNSVIDLSISKQDTGIQYRRQQKDEVKGFVPKPVWYSINIKVCYSRIYIDVLYM